MSDFEVVVIGGGPGGYVAAIRASQLGKKVALVEREHLGGICLNWGCIPTKTLLESAELIHKLKHSDVYGISTSSVEIDINKIVKHSQEISNKLTSGIKSLLKKHKITQITGTGKFLDANTIEVAGHGKISSNYFIIATGASPRVLPGFEINDNIWSYRQALRPTQIPKSMIIVGSGAIGIEFAYFYNMLGSKVTLLEAAERILPMEDSEIASIAQKSLAKQGIEFKTSIKLIKQITEQNQVTVQFEQQGKQHSIIADKLLMAVGIIGNSEGLGLENTKIKTDKQHIITNDMLQTAENHIYAIGDVAGAPWLAHKASHEGIIAAEHLAGKQPHKLVKNNIPACTYANPQIASVGLTEEAAKQQYPEIKVGRFPFMANGKAMIVGDTEGLIKTIFCAQTGELLGAHMVGHNVTELIQGYTITKQLEGTELDLIHTVFPHPTLSEMMHEAVLQAEKRAIHI